MSTATPSFPRIVSLQPLPWITCLLQNLYAACALAAFQPRQLMAVYFTTFRQQSHAQGTHAGLPWSIAIRLATKRKARCLLYVNHLFYELDVLTVEATQLLPHAQDLCAKLVRTLLQDALA